MTLINIFRKNLLELRGKYGENIILWIETGYFYDMYDIPEYSIMFAKIVDKLCLPAIYNRAGFAKLMFDMLMPHMKKLKMPIFVIEQSRTCLGAYMPKLRWKPIRIVPSLLEICQEAIIDLVKNDPGRAYMLISQ